MNADDQYYRPWRPFCIFAIMRMEAIIRCIGSNTVGMVERRKARQRSLSYRHREHRAESLIKRLICSCTMVCRVTRLSNASPWKLTIKQKAQVLKSPCSASCLTGGRDKEGCLIAVDIGDLDSAPWMYPGS